MKVHPQHRTPLWVIPAFAGMALFLLVVLIISSIRDLFTSDTQPPTRP